MGSRTNDKTVSSKPAGKVDVCCVCETPITGDYMQLLDGKKIKPECMKKVGVDPDDPSSVRLLRTKIENYKKGEFVIECPDAISKEAERRKSSIQEGEDFARRMQVAKAKAEEQRKKDEEAAAAEAARQHQIADAEEQKKKELAAAEAKAAADKEQGEAEKKIRLDAKGKWTIEELKDANLRKEYFVAELTEGKPEILLSDADFQTVLSMDRDAFEKLPGWRQKDARKKQGFF